MAETASDALLAAARSWHQGLGSSAPEWDDVEIVVRLRAVEVVVIEQLLLTNTASLLANLSALQSALAGGSAAPSEPAPEAFVPEPVAAVVAEPELEPTPDDGSEPGGVVGARLRRLTDWLSSAVAEGRDLGDLEARLPQIAEFGPTDKRPFRRWGNFAETNATEILGVLRAIGSPSGPASDAEARSVIAPAVTPDTSRVVESTQSTPGTPKGMVNTIGFADFTYSADQASSPPPPAKITFTSAADESLKMSWPAQPDDGLVRIYRVVTNDSYAPVASPTLGELICATTDSSAIDSREFSSPVRHVAIWCNEGANEGAARAAQPTLVAAGGCVLPVTHLEVREDEGSVIGQWEPIDGLVRIDVLRVPMAQAVQQQHYNHQYRVSPEAVGRGGFTDNEAVAGAEYEYRIYSVAKIGDQEELSPYFVSRRVKLQAVVVAVDDLFVVACEGSESTYDLTWTMPPLGNVELYRSERPPAAGITQQVLSRSSLERAELTSDLKLARALDRQGDAGSMRNVPWPSGWSRAYFTPVTVLNEEQMRVGKTQILTRSSSVSHVRLIERVDEQFLTFAWPDGVTMVKIYQTAAGIELVNAQGHNAIAELSAEEYAKYGGAHLPHSLPADGCAVHVVGTSYAAGQAVLSSPVTINYPGLARLTYDVIPAGAGGRRKRGQDTLRKVVVYSDIAPENVPLVLIHNPKRLPLFSRDGVEVARRSLSFTPNTPQVFNEQIDLAGMQGFIRLFVDVPPEFEHRLAVLDPAVEKLRCG